jgi:hypothetical protein
MRNSFKALLVLITVLACSASAASAATATRTLNPHLLSARAGWVGQFDATTLAYGARTVGSGIQVLSDGTGAPRTVAAPAGPQGCAGTAAGSRHLLFTCELGYTDAVDNRRAVVTAPDGTVQASVDYALPIAGADGTAPGYPDAIGDQWIHHAASCHHCSEWSEDLNWHTGEVRRPDLRALTSYEDVNAAGLLTPLCAPLSQMPAPDIDFASLPQTLGVQISGKWVLQGVAIPGPYGNPTLGWQLRHCGTTKVYKMPTGTSPVALAGGFVVLMRLKSRTDERASMELLRLRDRRVFRVGGTWSGYDLGEHVAATAHRLLILGDALNNRSLWSVILPQR